MTEPIQNTNVVRRTTTRGRKVTVSLERFAKTLKRYRDGVREEHLRAALRLSEMSYHMLAHQAVELYIARRLSDARIIALANPTVEEQLLDFVARASLNRLTSTTWLDDGTLSVYVRLRSRSPNGESGDFLDIANVAAVEVGRGRFSRFLARVEELRPFDGAFIECVLQKRFADYFRARGWNEDTPESPGEKPCFYRLWAVVPPSAPQGTRPQSPVPARER